MEVITINHPHQYPKDHFPPMAMALGYFDGVHLGHRKVILEANNCAEKEGWSSAVMTFDPHPSVVLAKNRKQKELITPLQDKTQLIAELGIDYLFIIRFTSEFASLLPQEFVDRYIIGLNVKHVVAGFDYTYGRMGKGTMETLPFHSRKQFHYTVIPKLVNKEEKISSTLIRSMIKNGQMEELPPLLGRFHRTTGTVIRGDQRGGSIGFPTANIRLEQKYLLPPLGVYAVRILVNGRWHNGVCNMGYKPTFHQNLPEPSLEVHIFDFNAQIYHEIVTVEWHVRLREEKKFSGIDELVEQIASDKRAAQQYFSKGTMGS